MFKKSCFVSSILLFLWGPLAFAEVEFARAEYEVAHYWSDNIKFTDKENNGFLDVLSNGDGITVYERIGSGFIMVSREAASTRKNGDDFIAYDVNGDGFEDIVMSYPWRILLNDGNGHYAITQTVNKNSDLPDVSGNFSIRSQPADLDKNGKLDLIVTVWRTNEEYGYGTTHVIKNVYADAAADGLFAYEEVIEYSKDTNLSGLEAQTARGVTIGDVNGDGLDDLIFINAFTNYSTTSFTASVVALNDGNGNFVASQYISEANDIALGDLDGDGDLDLFLARSDNFSIAGADEAEDEVWLNDGTGSFAKSSQYLDQSDSLGVELADFDGDGDLDAFVANRNQTGLELNQAHIIWLNDGAGLFAKSAFSFGGNYPVRSMEVVDIDQDGDKDLVVLGGSAAINPNDDPEYRGTLENSNEVWLNQLVPNVGDNNDGSYVEGYQDGLEHCQNNPGYCGLYDQDQYDNDLLISFEEGMLECQSNPEQCGLYSQEDLDQAYLDGWADGFAEGLVEGEARGIASCQNDPASCGLFDESDLNDAEHEAIETLALEIGAALNKGQIKKFCKALDGKYELSVCDKTSKKPPKKKKRK